MAITSFYRIPVSRGYSNRTFYIEDRSDLSPDYFDVTSFPTIVGGGRYLLVLRGNDQNLKIESPIDVEIIDSVGKNIYAEVLAYEDRFNNYYISFDIYDITAAGIATIHVVGIALFDFEGREVPQSLSNQFNIRWSKDFEVLPYERNNAELFFDKAPSVSVVQVTAPLRAKTRVFTGGLPYNVITSSASQLSIIQSNFQGYDRDFGSSEEILDPRIRAISINPNNQPATINSVNTTLREVDQDIEAGYKISYTNRFGTFLTATSSFFSKSFLGGYFEFHSSASTPQTLLPTPPATTIVSGSPQEQLSSYGATIVEVINDTKCIINIPLSVDLVEENQTYTYREARNFTGSVSYIPTSTTFSESTTVNQSYLEFTFENLAPASGEVYRIKSYAKLGSITGEYKQLNDQIIQPVEYLTDAKYPNPTNYSKYDSEYRIIGQFSNLDVLTQNWQVHNETPASIGAALTPNYNNSVLIESACLTASNDTSSILTTKYSQNYTMDQAYTLSFYVVLDPYMELEIYGNSDNLSTNIITPLTQPKAFLASRNSELERYPANTNRFGKYIGKIQNDSASQKYYGRVLFDYETDSNGFGRPLFRARVVDETPGITGYAYVSDISIKPYTLNGFTPKLVQFAVPVPEELSKALLLSQSIDFKIDYFDYTGKQSENTTFIDDLVVNFKTEIPSNTCQAQNSRFEYYSGVGNFSLVQDSKEDGLTVPGTDTTTTIVYLNLSITKEQVVSTVTNTVVFSSAAFATPPSGTALTPPTKADFLFFINGQFIEPSAVTSFTDNGNNTCTVVFDTSILKYTLGPVDIVTAVGKFDPTI